MQGKFITVEGIEGVGKSSNIDVVKRQLETMGFTVKVTREPGGTPLGEDIRQLLLGHRDDDMASETELLLMFAARAEHLAKVIIPALENGHWVISDRFTDATFAYQGGGRGIGFSRIALLESWVQHELRPHMTLLLDAPVALALERAGKRGNPDRFEKEHNQFFEKVRAAYLDLATKFPARYRVIDASQSFEEVQNDIKSVLDKAISSWH